MASAPFLVPIDLNNLEIQNVKLQSLSPDPTAGVGEGSIFINSSVHRPKWHDGTNFNDIYPFSTTLNGTGVLRDASGNFSAGTITANITGNVSGSSGSCTGNAATVTNGVYTNGTYSNPSWITDLAGSKITGNISGNAAGLSSTLAVGSGGTGTTNGSITGTGAIVFSAGGTDKNLTLTATGTGSIVATSDINLSGKSVLNSATTDNSSDDNTLATCGYVRAIAQSLDVKGSVKVATTGNLTSLSGLFTLNGVALDGNYRVLVKDQTDKTQNGIYLAQTGAWTRALDMDSASEVPGAFTFVEGGDTLASTGWVATATVTGLIGTFDITWTQFSGAGTYTAGRGMVQSGTAFNFAQASDYTAGRIPFAGATDALGTASTKIGFNSNFVWDNGNSRLGIGTATPATTLHVFGTGAKIRIATNATDSGTIDLSATSTSAIINAKTYATAVPLKFQINDSDKLTIGTDGTFTWSNVGAVATAMTLNATGLGIGTAPGAMFHVKGTSPTSIFENTGNTAVYLQLKRPNQLYYIALDINNNGGRDFTIYDGTANASRLTLDSSGNLGLGGSPISKLTVNGGTGDGATYDSVISLTRTSSTANVLASKIVLTDKNTNYGNIVFRIKTTPSSGESAAYYTDALTIDGQLGNLGLGVTPNAWSTGYKAIQLSGQGVSIFGSTATSYAGIGSNGFYDGTKWVYNNSAPGGQYVIDQNVHKWYNVASGSATTEIVWNTRMVLDASGYLGINTASPSTRLHIKGTAGGVGCTFRLEPASSTTIYSQIVGNNGDISIEADPANNEATSAIKFNVDGSLKALIDASGNLSIGTSSAASNTGINVYAQKSIFGSGGGGTGPRGGFYSTSTEIYLGLDDSVQADGTGFLVGSDYFYIRRTSTTGTTDFNNNSSTGSITFGTGASGTTRLTIASTGAATFTGTVTAKSSGTGTGQVPVKFVIQLSSGSVTVSGNAYTMTHSLGTKDVHVSVRRSTDNLLIYADVAMPSDDTVTVTFASAITASAYYVTIIG